MAELIVDMLISVDGSAYGTRSPGYFGLSGPDLEHWIATEDAIPRLNVMGRNTYEMMADLPAGDRDESWETMSKKPTLVFSRTLTTSEWPGVELCANDVVDEIGDRKQRSGRDLLTVGSLSLVQQLLNAGLVDHMRLLVFPLVLGESGEKPLFANVGDFALELVDQQVMDAGTLLLHYRPAGDPPYAE